MSYTAKNHTEGPDKQVIGGELNFTEDSVVKMEEVTMFKGLHLHWSAAEAHAAVADAIHAAKACPAINVAASAAVKAASALTDILTISNTVALGETSNALKVLLMTAAGDTLAVTKTDGTKTINIALANTTAAKNTASLIQSAIRTLTSVGGIAVSGVTCAAGGNWDTAAIATGETGAISFSGGLSPIDVITTDITNPPCGRNITATAGGTAGDIKAIQVTVKGKYRGNAVTDVLPAFTVDTTGIVTGSKAFDEIDEIDIPAMDGLGATVSVGYGDKLGLPVKLTHDTVLATYVNNAKEGTPAAVAFDEANIENNTLDPASSLAGTVVDAYLMV